MGHPTGHQPAAERYGEMNRETYSFPSSLSSAWTTAVHVLLIEDNPGDARLVQEGLRAADSKMNIQVEWVDCLAKGLERLGGNKIQAVLVDLALPDSQGLETLLSVLAHASHIPVIVMTGEMDEELGIKAMQAGAQDYLVKGQGDGRFLRRVIQHAIQRKQTELQLADALEFNERLLVSSPVGIFTYRLSGECLSANTSAAQMVGGTIEQLRSQNFHRIESWKRSGLYRLAMQTITTGKPAAGDIHVVSTFGKESWYTAQFALFRSGGEDLLLMMFSDISERKQAEMALAASERFAHETLDALTAHIAILDESGKIVAVNCSWREFAQANGLNPALVSEGVNYLSICDAATGRESDLAADMAAGIRAVMRGQQESYAVEYSCHSPDVKRWFIARVTKFQGEGPLRVVVSHEDITERKLAEEALRESEENYRQLFDAESDAIFLIENATGQILQANRAACSLYGYSQPELLARRNTDLSAEPEQTQQVTQDTPLAPDHVIHIPLRYHRKRDGMVFPVEITGRFFLHHGRPVHIAAIRDITERKHAEAALEASEKRFRAWIENSSDIITVVDATGVIQYESPSIKRVLGYHPEDLLGKNAFDFICPEDHDRIIALFLDTIQSPDKVSFAEFRFRDPSGSWRFLEAVGRAYVDEFGEVVGLINSRDITERKEVEAAIAAMQTRFQALIENAPDGIALLGLDGRLRQVTPSTQQILGYTIEESQGQEPALLTHPDDLPDLLAGLNDLVQNPDLVIRRQYRFKHNDGSWRWLESTISNLIAEPSVQSIVFNYRDITEQRQAQEALRDSEIRYRALMENSVEAIYLYELDTRQVVMTNPAFLKLLGYKPEDLSNLTLYDIVANERESVDLFLEKVISDGGIFMGERHWRHKTGRIIPVEVTANRLQQADGDLIFVVGRDISERKQAEETLREKEHLLLEAQRIGQIGSWSYDISAGLMKFSEEMYRLLDVQPEDFHHDTQDFLALVYPSDRAAAAQWLQDMKAGLQARKLDFRLFRKNGELRYLQCGGAIDYDQTGKPRRFIGTTQDVTDRKVAELQIDQQLRRLTALAEIDRAIISSFDQRYTLGVILSQVISQLQVDAASVLLFDPQSQMLRYGAGRGFRTKLIETAHFSLGTDFAGRVAGERRMIRVLDLQETSHNPALDTFVAAEGFVSYIGVPLLVKGTVKGVLEVFHRSSLLPYQEWLDFFNTLAGQAALAVDNASLFGNLQATNEELMRAYDATIEGWSRAMDLRDRETEGHTQRVTDLTLELARAMGLEDSSLVHIRRGALLHDIGKLGVPDSILLKPDRLTVEEWKIMKKHPEFAFDMLSPIEYLKPALNIPYCHHEKWDGTGYPLGLRGEQIPLEARIFAVADVWDALSSDRPYRNAWPSDKTFEYICGQSGKHFDPRVVDCFIQLMNRR